MKIFKIIPIFFLLIAPVYGQNDIKDEVFDLAMNNMDEFVEFLSYPNDSSFSEDIYNLIEWTKNKFKSLDFLMTELETSSIPLLLAEKKIHDDLKTILIYLHLDGQPVDITRWNQEDAFKPVFKKNENGIFIEDDWNKIASYNYSELDDKDIRIFARSSSDAKGPVMMLIQALKFMKLKNIDQEFNIKLIMDFEEEIGSPSLPSAVEVHKEKLESDALLIFDGPQHASGLPTLNFGNRGISSITLKTYGPIVPQHSGHFGNYAPNPVFRMSNILSSMKDENGIVKIKGYYDGINITDEVKEYLDAVPDNEDEMKDKMEFFVEVRIQ